MNKVLLIYCICLLQSCGFGNTQRKEEVNPANEKASTLCRDISNNCTFVLYSEVENKYTYVNKARAAQQFTPASTFKIANSLIALELGIVSNPEQKLFIDQTKYPPQAWWNPQWNKKEYNLISAFQNSVYPIYQGIANTIGPERMALFLERFDYGNQDISSGIDSFWLSGSLKISAIEQISFLRKLYHNEFNLQKTSLDALKTIMLVDETQTYHLFAKTGSGFIAKNKIVGWYVGYVENNVSRYYFAFNLDGEPSPVFRQLMIDMCLAHLKQAGVI